ncbi:MAG: glycosyltransferase [Candidatus Sericytochromatia bacterium]|nr:glycosyltransferase [Candidatus Sericytochromatia bacterium]
MARILLTLPVAWHELAQRFHHVARRLAARHELVVLAPRPHGRLWRAGRLGEWLTPWSVEPLAARGRVVSVPPLPLYRRAPWATRWQWRRFPRRLAAAAAALAPPGGYDVLWLADPLHAPLIDLVAHRRLVYEAVDDHAGFWPGPLQPAVRAAEEAACRRADQVIATAEALAERLVAWHTGVAVVGNGVEVAHFAAVGTLPPGPPPPGLAGWHGPSVGFYGALGPWVDLARVAALARAHPHVRFVLLGPAEASLAAVAGLANVLWVPPVPYEALPAWLAHVPVWLLPFHDTPLTRAVDPLKVHEYLAAGRRVVASPLPALAGLADVVALPSDAAGWLAALDAALAAGPLTAAERARLAPRLAERDWDALVARLEACALGSLDPA